MRKLSLLCVLLLAISFVSCDLLTGSKVDMYKTISDEVDWANAPKLEVRIEFPAAWGISSPAQGDITPDMDIRKGFEFSVEFTPDIMYSLHSWMVFRTEDLKNLSYPASWVENPDLTEKIQSLGPDDVELPEVNTADRVYKFKIFTTDPVTLVPWCDTEPRITRTEPRNRPDGPPFSRASDITLYFNGALDADTVKFASSETGDGIWITALSGDDVKTNSTESWFSTPEYAATGGFFTVTMKSAKLPPAESLMTVTVHGIKNSQGNPMASAGYSFSWKTSRDVNVNLTSYSATYNDDEKKIEVTYNQTNAEKVVTYYRLNKGANIEFTGSITNVPALNDSGVKEGRQITGMAEYEIFIELYVDEIMESRTIFKIWNFPGMSVSNTVKAVEITTADELIAMKDNLGGQFVLANDIVVNEKWTPVGSFILPDGVDTSSLDPSTLDPADFGVFYGKFYGNGHTITLNNGIKDGSLQGLFGFAFNSLIRDFTLVYNSSGLITINSDPVFGGGFIGSVTGMLMGTEARNIIVSGGGILKVTSSGNIISIGGIAGSNEGKIENCCATLSVEYYASGDADEVKVGAITGSANPSSDKNFNFNNGYDPATVIYAPVVDGVTVSANVSANMRSYAGRLNIGGAVGGSSKNTLKDITFTSGVISFSRELENYAAGSGDNYINNCGGIVGRASQINIIGCSFSGDIKTINESVADGSSNIGGIAGGCDTGNESASYYFHDCNVWGNINFKGNYIILVGGLFGFSQNIISIPSNIYVTDCFFNDGNITVTSTTENNITVGGVLGELHFNHFLNKCGAFKGLITVTGKDITIGGFTGNLQANSGTGGVSKGFSNIDIIVNCMGSRCNVGGFLSSTGNNITVKDCYATGTVSVASMGSAEISAGGLVGVNDGEINNSYALGNVVVHYIEGTGNAVAGGLVGNNRDNGKISNCFSAGQVSAQSAPTNNANSGGIVGGNTNGKIGNTAALGKSVTALGYTKSAGRIYGYPSTNLSAVTGNGNNYALNTMVIEEDAYNATAPATRNPVSNATGRDGLDTYSTVFFTQSFWTTTLNFPSTDWDFSRVGKDGYPRLLNVGGQQ